MKLSTLFTVALTSAPALVQGECFGGDKKRPDHGLEVIEFMYSAGCALQQSGNLQPGKEFWKSTKTSDGICVNVNIWNKGNDGKSLTSSQAIDAWTREWVGCEHGGRTKYDDGFEYS
ncbi:hypothetical protein BKA67DRAFT_534754 [Truncatella angustata]|uniref:Secreted protein n=1 Tax=Truncatella angustata TaxID=152316 RepID=A0A9P8UPU1_9PEZI|nr:uncharacterized protein BKA67DRAFT_534754 [Truncatella angustata]KAH6655849.1 hypothetical protein BKA67DRAFT_534754 [Truncatella angustata]